MSTAGDILLRLKHVLHLCRLCQCKVPVVYNTYDAAAEARGRRVAECLSFPVECCAKPTSSIDTQPNHNTKLDVLTGPFTRCVIHSC